MKTWQAIVEAIGSILGAKELVSLVAEYATPTRESLAHEFGLMACQRTQQLLDLGRGNVLGDINKSKNLSYANLQAIRKLYHEINSGPHLNINNFSPVEIQAYLAMILKMGGCQEYSAISYCYLRNIPNINSCFSSIDRYVFTIVGAGDVKHNHAFIKIGITEPGTENTNYIIVDPWANYVGNSENAKGLKLINDQSAMVVYNSARKIHDTITQNIFILPATKVSLGAGLEFLFDDARNEFTPKNVGVKISKDKCIYQMPALLPPQNMVTANPATIVIPEVQSKKEPVKAKVEVVHGSEGMSAYAHAAKAVAPKQETASAVLTTTAASAPKNASATVSAAAEPPAAQPAGNSNTQAASPATPSMGSGPS